VAFYKRSIFLINPAFQIRFSLIFTALLFISSLIYPLIFVDFMNEVVASHPEVAGTINPAKRDLLIFIIPIQLLFSAFVFIFAIFMTHKIAGPLYKLKNHLVEIKDGGEITPLKFRQGDHFHDVAEEVSSFLEVIAENQQEDFRYLDEVTAYVNNLSGVIPEDKRPVLNEISRRLTEIHSRYKSDL
jgi:signal transduction histidine kinase